MLRVRSHLPIVLLLLLLGCGRGSDDEPPDAGADTAGNSGEQAPVSELFDGLVQLAVAGQAGWRYSRAVSTDLNGDGRLERAVLISNVEVRDGRPFWEDGHHWQMYIETDEGERTHVYARFVPLGAVRVWLAHPASGTETPRILLQEETPHRVAAYEIAYHGLSEVQVYSQFEYALDPGRGFSEMLEE